MTHSPAAAPQAPRSLDAVVGDVREMTRKAFAIIAASASRRPERGSPEDLRMRKLAEAMVTALDMRAEALMEAASVLENAFGETLAEHPDILVPVYDACQHARRTLDDFAERRGRVGHAIAQGSLRQCHRLLTEQAAAVDGADELVRDVSSLAREIGCGGLNA